jgi:acyl carrier protein
MSSDSLEKLKAAFAAVLPVDAETDFADLRYSEAQGWDSVAHMSLVAEIEAAFDVMMSTDEVIGMSSFSKAKDILTGHGVSFD